jgi:hypothetical protein
MKSNKKKIFETHNNEVLKYQRCHADMVGKGAIERGHIKILI